MSCGIAVLLAAAGAGTASADFAGTAKEIQDAYGRPYGAVVHVGAGAGELAVQLADGNKWIVHGVEPDAAAVAKATGAALKAGVGGRVWVEKGDVNILPHVNILANMVVVDDWSRVSKAGLDAAELLRILAPNGLACVGGKDAKAAAIKEWIAKSGVKGDYVQTGASWVVFKKARPAGMDEWTHKWHDATRNQASQDTEITVPENIQWINSEAYTWSMRHYRTAGERVFLFFDRRGGQSRWGHRKEQVQTIEALDAYSGTQLWKINFPLPEGGFDPIALDDRVLVMIGKGLTALDAATGKSLLVYTELGAPDGGVAAEGVLVGVEPGVARGVDLKTGAKLWEVKPSSVPRNEGKRGWVSGFQTYCVVAAEGMAILMDRGQTESKTNVARLVGYNLRTGKEQWSFEDPAFKDGYYRYFVYQGAVVVCLNKGYFGVPLKDKDGRKWTINVSNVGKEGKWTEGGQSKHLFGVNDCLWIRESGGFYLNAPTNAVPDPANRPAKTWVGFDPKTGQEVKRLGYKVTGSWQQRCYPDLGTPAFILSSNNELLDFKKPDEITIYRAIRSSCGEGPFFGNGLMYLSPHWCCFCYPMVRGAAALNGAIARPIVVKDEDRLEKGPAYKESEATIAPIADHEWPMFRRTLKRNAGTPAALTLPLRDDALWTLPFKDRISGPVIAGGRIYVTLVDQGRIVALDEKTRKEIWTFMAGPRIDLPPTLYAGQLLFGCHDGYIYAVRAEDGQLAWRFHAAPEKRRMSSCERMESSWPVMGSATIHNGTLYGLAGRITKADGGMHMYALDPVNGRMKWRQKLAGTTEPRVMTGIACWYVLEGHMQNSIPVGHEDEVRLFDQHFAWQFSAKTGEQIIPASSNFFTLAKYVNSETPWVGFDRITASYLINGQDPGPELQFHFETGTPMCYPAPDSFGLMCMRIRNKRMMKMFGCKPDTAGGVWTGIPDSISKTNALWLRYLESNPDIVAKVAALTDMTNSVVTEPDGKIAYGATAAKVMGKFGVKIDDPAVPAFEADLRKAGAIQDKAGLPIDPGKLAAVMDRWSWVDLDVHALAAAGNAVLIGGQGFDPKGPEAEIRAMDIKTGAELGRTKLPSSPIVDGIAIAYDKVYVATQDGTLMCFGAKPE